MTPPQPDLLDTIHAAFTTGYDLGYTHGQRDREQEADHETAHDITCRTIGLRPHDGPPPWAIQE